MKTATLTLKRKVLVIELPEHTADFSVLNTGDKNAVCAFNEYDECLEVYSISTSYTLLGSPDDLKEEYVKDLVENYLENVEGMENIPVYRNYLATKEDLEEDHWSHCADNALESFNSALEKEIFWVNPLGAKPLYATGHGDKKLLEKIAEGYLKTWEEAETRTFDRSRTLIFVEN